MFRFLLHINIPVAAPIVHSKISPSSHEHIQRQQQLIRQMLLARLARLQEVPHRRHNLIADGLARFVERADGREHNRTTLVVELRRTAVARTERLDRPHFALKSELRQRLADNADLRLRNRLGQCRNDADNLATAVFAKLPQIEEVDLLRQSTDVAQAPCVG